VRRALVPFVVLPLLLVACGADPTPDVEATLPVEEPTDEPTDDPAEEPDEGETDGDDVDAGPQPDADAGPEPDADALADPCADHQGREDEAFLELVAPVQDQRVTDELTLVGCSNVFEATVSWRILDGDGRTLDEGFTTAECGSGCVGAFEETVELDATATAEPFLAVQVFWEDAADGSDRDLVEVGVIVGD
jgi:hypothetical protein